MKILEVLRIPRYAIIAVLATIGMIGVYAFTQVLFIVENLDLWFTVIPLQNLILFLVFSGLFGITLSYQIYMWKQPKTCSLKKKSAPGTIGTMISFLVVQCPACASLGALFLPLSAISLLTTFSIWITVGSIALVLFTLIRLGGLSKTPL